MSTFNTTTDQHAPDHTSPGRCAACLRPWPCAAAQRRGTDETDTRAVLVMLRDRLRARNVDATGPLPGIPSPEFDYLELPGGRRVLALRDRDGHWQAHVYTGRDLVRMADVDAGDWPGDPVAIGEE